MVKKHIIWSNFNLDVDDWRDDILAEEPNLSDDDIYFRMVEANESFLDDERLNLNIRVPEGIICIAELGLWNGKRQGYRLFGNSIANCFNTRHDFTEWYLDERGDFRCNDAHHDGTNHYLYRAFKPSISETQKENFLAKIYQGQADKKDITRYTRSLGKEIAAVYGW